MRIGCGTRETYASVECVAVKVPAVHELYTVASVLCPGVAVDQRRVQCESKDANRKEDTGQHFADNRARWYPKALNTVGKEVEFLTEGDNSEIEGREIMVQEELSRHEVEGEVVESPAKYAGTDFVVEPLEVHVVVVTTAPLPAKNRDSLENNVDNDGHG